MSIKKSMNTASSKFENLSGSFPRSSEGIYNSASTMTKKASSLFSPKKSSSSRLLSDPGETLSKAASSISSAVPELGSTLGSTYLNVTMGRDGQTLAGGIFIATGNNTGGTNGARAKVEIYTWNQTSNSWDLVDVIEETESPYGWKWNVNLSKNGEVLTLGGTASTDVDVYQFTQYTSEPT